MKVCASGWEKGRRCRVQAFTLLEIMVALTILVLLMVFVAQLLNNTMSVTSNGSKRMDADTQARTALDRMAFDIAKMTKRADIDYYLKKQTPGNDQLAFFSETTGYYPASITSNVPKSNVSLVGYRINNHQLERLGKALIWNGVSSSTSGAAGLTANDRPMVFLPQTIPLTWPTVIDNGADTDYQVIGEQIFRLEFCYLVRNSTTTAVLSGNPYLPPNTATSLNGLSDVVAIVVSIAVLDSKSRAIVTDTALAAAEANLDDVSGATISDLPLKLWQARILDDGLGLPAKAAAQVRVYQRYCYLNRSQ